MSENTCTDCGNERTMYCPNCTFRDMIDPAVKAELSRLRRIVEASEKILVFFDSEYAPEIKGKSAAMLGQLLGLIKRAITERTTQ